MAARVRWELLAIGCALLGVALRCLPWRGVFDRDGVVFLDVDPYYHLRRAGLIVEQFPTLPKFDAWIGCRHESELCEFGRSTDFAHDRGQFHASPWERHHRHDGHGLVYGYADREPCVRD